NPCPAGRSIQEGRIEQFTRLMYDGMGTSLLQELLSKLSDIWTRQDSDHNHGRRERHQSQFTSKRRRRHISRAHHQTIARVGIVTASRTVESTRTAVFLDRARH